MKFDVRLSLIFVTLATVGCATKTEMKDLKNENFALQTRIQQLENVIVENSKANKTQGQSTSQQAAAANIRIDVVERDIQKLKGEIDGLKVGVRTGQLPEGEESGAESVGQRLAVLVQRMEAMEAAQAELLEQASKAPEKPSKAAKEGSKAAAKDATEGDDKAIKNVKELRDAFAKNRFKSVAVAAAELEKTKLKKGEKEEVLFLHAESLFKAGQVKEAALKFNEVLDLNPSGERGAQIRMRMGDCFRLLGDNNTSRIYYEELLQKHPKSAQAQKAKERLSKLN